MPTFTCGTCQSAFTLPQHVVDRFPGWTPRQCLSCRDADREATTASPGSGGVTRSSATGVSSRSGSSPADPSTGVFTDGGASPNPGPGGWGVVHVQDHEIINERWGHDPDTTNNRMELMALIEAARLVPQGTPVTIYSDSSLSVNTITQWAAGWE